MRTFGALTGVLLAALPHVASAQSFSTVMTPSTDVPPATEAKGPTLSFGAGSRFLLGDGPFGAFAVPQAFEPLRNGGSAGLRGPTAPQPLFSVNGNVGTLSWDLGAAALTVAPVRRGETSGQAVQGQVTVGYDVGPVTVFGVGGVASDRAGGIGSTSFVQGGAAVDAPLSFTLGAQMGYQWSSGTGPAAEIPGRRWSIGIGRDVAGFNMSLQYGETGETRNVCDVASGAGCGDQRVLFSIDRRF